jgi:heme A synthase
MVVSPDESPPARSSAGLTGFRYLLAILVLVALATGPMVLAVAAGLTSLTSSTPPDPEPFLRPAEQEVRVMEDPDEPAELQDRGGAEYR